MISIVMADDHPMIREGIRSMIERHANLKVLGEASGGVQALELVERLQPDVLLLDLRMSTRVRRISPRTRVLILTTYDTDRDILAAIEAGAGGYVLKDIEPARLAEAIRATAGGRTVLDQRAAEAVANRMRGESREEGLSGQEERVLSLAAGGKTNRQIARILNLGETTVKTYFSRIFAKLGVAEAMRRGIIPSRDGQA